MTGLVVIVALGVSILAYIAIGHWLGRASRVLADHLPVALGERKHVASAAEFSASTVAMTISLATVLLAFFELAPYLGLWLLWTAITTALGLVAVRLTAPRIWARMAEYGDRRPTLHEFLGVEYESRILARAGAACTSVGFLGAFAVELTAGSRFLGHLMPEVPPTPAVIVLAVAGLTYTVLGGFRAVIVTDRIQMAAIWCLLAALAVFYAWVGYDDGAIARVPRDAYELSWRDGLTSFLLGIFVMNVPTFVADMSVWQRIAGTRDRAVVIRGLGSSTGQAVVTWTTFVLLACFAPAVATAVEGENPLVGVVRAIGEHGALGYVGVFVCVIGLYGAALSTASTQLVAVTQTVQEDLIAGPSRVRVNDATELRRSRLITAGAAVVAVVIVELLTAVGFSIADLVFAIYGAQLGLCGPVLLALFWPRVRLRALGSWASAGVIAGFATGWCLAAIGRVTGIGDLVFLSPVGSLVISGALLCVGALFHRRVGSGRS